MPGLRTSRLGLRSYWIAPLGALGAVLPPCLRCPGLRRERRRAAGRLASTASRGHRRGLGSRPAACHLGGRRFASSGAAYRPRDSQRLIFPQNSPRDKRRADFQSEFPRTTRTPARGDRHHHQYRPSGLPYLRRARRVRAGADRRAGGGGPRRRAGPRPPRRPARRALPEQASFRRPRPLYRAVSRAGGPAPAPPRP